MTPVGSGGGEFEGKEHVAMVRAQIHEQNVTDLLARSGKKRTFLAAMPPSSAQRGET